jgi:hypothetical protein
LKVTNSATNTTTITTFNSSNAFFFHLHNRCCDCL